MAYIMFKRIFNGEQVRQAIQLYERCRSFRKVAYQLKISKSTIHRWWSRFHYNAIYPKICKHRKRSRRSKYPNLQSEIMNIVNAHHDLTYFSLTSIQHELNIRYQQVPSISTIHRMLNKSKVSRRRFTNTKVCPKNEQAIQENMVKFKDTIDKLSDDEIVCLDETGFCNIGNSVYGYFPKGKQPIMHNVPKRLRMSLMMAIGNNKIVNYRLQKDAFNTNYFIEYLETLLPCLDDKVKVILMDNVAFHKSKRVKELLHSYRIAPLFIPPYSPRCNPIEEVFSEMKRTFRTSKENTFQKNLMKTITNIQEYKSIQKHYNHTRQYVQSCQGL